MTLVSGMSKIYLLILKTDSSVLIAKDVKKTNFLEWTCMRYSILPNLKASICDHSTTNPTPSFKINNGLFDTTKKKSKDYYILWITEEKRLFAKLCTQIED